MKTQINSENDLLLLFLKNPITGSLTGVIQEWYANENVFRISMLMTHITKVWTLKLELCMLILYTNYSNLSYEVQLKLMIVSRAHEW